MKNLLALLALAPLSTLRADQLTVGCGVGGVEPGTQAQLTLPGFDAKLGTLQRVEIVFRADLSGQLELENRNKMPTWAHVDVDALTSLRSEARELLIAGRDKAAADLILAPYDGSLDLTGPSSANLWLGISFHKQAALTGDLQAFVGEKVSLLAGMRAGFDVIADGVLSRVDAWADYRIQVTYVYVPASGGPKTPQELDPTAEISPKDALRPSPSLEVEKA